MSLIKYFEKECDVFVHFDKKSNVTDAFVGTIENMPHVKKVFRKFSVSWGGFSMLKCEMYMLKQATMTSDAGYFHLFSGQDYPIKPLGEFLRFFDEHYGLNFLSYTHLPNTKWQQNTFDRLTYFAARGAPPAGEWQQNTFDRLTYFYPTDIVHSRQSLASIMQKWKKWQKKLHIRRSIPQHFDHIYGGSQWFSLSRMGTSALLKYTNQNKWFYWRFMFTFAPEEVYVHSVLVNILPKNLIFPYNYRFIRWKNENGNIPSNLGKEHFHLLAESMDLFARKFEQPYSENLMPLINKYLIGDTPCHITDRGVWVYDGYKRYHYEERFADALCQYLHWINATDVVDAGCGAGFLVAALRRRKAMATGFDANPYTPQLSALLLPQGDTPCYEADLAQNIQA